MHDQATRRGQRGLSLIELMIAITLGVVLMLGMVEVFGTTRAVYQTTSALARAQEGGRFAMDFLRTDLRLAGQWGCFNEYMPTRSITNHLSDTFDGARPLETGADWPYRSDLPIEVFEYELTAPGDAVDLPKDPLVADAANKWSPTLPSDLADVVGDAEAPAVAFSDIFAIRYASPTYVPLKGGTVLASGIVAVDPTDADFIDAGRVYVITDCQKVSILQLNTAPTVVDQFPTSPGLEAASTALIGAPSLNIAQPGSPSGPGWEEGDYTGSSGVGEGSPIHQYRMAVYYVGLPAGETVPSLIRRELVLDAGQMVFTGPQRMVDGIEAMQLTVGASPPMVGGVLAGLGGQAAEGYMTAETLLAGENNDQAAAYVDAFRRVKKVRAALLLRGLEPAAVGGEVLTYNVGDVSFQTENDDASLRAVYEAVVAIRNRY